MFFLLPSLYALLNFPLDVLMSGTLPVYTSTAELSSRLISSINYQVMNWPLFSKWYICCFVFFIAMLICVYWTPHTITVHACLYACKHGSHTNYWVTFWVTAMCFQLNARAYHSLFFTFTFGVSLIISISIKYWGILSFLMHYKFTHISCENTEDWCVFKGFQGRQN